MPDADLPLTRLLAELTDAERTAGVLYRFLSTVEAGTTLTFAHITIPVPWQATLAFVDQEPMANWGHACRYLLINPRTGQSTSIPARFPPFTPDTRNRWRAVYRAPNLPDAVLAAPSSLAEE